jgi:hypothetical protein
MREVYHKKHRQSKRSRSQNLLITEAAVSHVKLSASADPVFPFK